MACKNSAVSDLTIDVWKSTLVMEDADYILENFEVEDFILQSAKNMQK